MSFFRRGIPSLTVSLLFVAGLYGQADSQTQSPRTGSSSVSTDLKKRWYVRPVSVGASLAVLGQIPLLNGDFADSPRTNFVRTATTGARGYRIGWGGVAQVRLPGKYAFAGSLLMHKSGHSSTIDTYDGIDNPNTPLDDRVHITIQEESITNYWDYAFMLRRYTKDHTTSGHRAFFGGGFNFRDVRRVRTNRETTLGADTIFDTQPVVPSRDMGRGIVGSIGAQFTDDFGIKIVPEFRFTRWLQPTWESLSTRSRKNQFEAMVSITF